MPGFLNRKDEPGIQLVVPGDDLPGTPRETVFSVEATAQNTSTEDEDELLLLLGVKHLNKSTTARIGSPKQLRWLHLTSNGMEFNSFLRGALEAYGFDHLQHPGAQASITKFFDRFLAVCEESVFRGGRFRTVPASTKIQLLGRAESVTVNFTAIPYFLLQEAQSPPKRNTASRTKMHWVQPLVQSGYHLDSSMARENQQAIRRLYSHVKQIIHVPQLWLLSIGDKFVATCSPTPVYDCQRSSITTRAIGGQDAFPPTIRATTASGFVFCLERSRCRVWFEFLYRVQSVMSSVSEASIDTRNWVYKLEADGSLIDAHRWRSLLQSHDDKLLAILASPKQSETKPSAKFVPELRYPSGVSDILKQLDQRMLEHHERRLRAMDPSDGFKHRIYTDHPYQYIDPYYWPPEYVLEAARSQSKKGQGQSQSQPPSEPQSQLQIKTQEGGISLTPTSRVEAETEGDKRQEKQPVFKWSVGKSAEDLSDDPDANQRMRALLAYIHRHILFLSDPLVAKAYNELPIQTKSGVDEQIDTFRTHQVNGYIIDLIITFVRYMSDILDEFIDSNYECIVKGKVWAAVSAMIETFRFGTIDIFLPYQINILALPLGPILRQIQGLREGLAGVANPSIPSSLVEAFLQIVILLVEASSEASRLITNVRDPPNPEARDFSPESRDPLRPPSPPRNASHKHWSRRTTRLRSMTWLSHEPTRSDRSYSCSESDSERDRSKFRARARLPYDPDSDIDQLFAQLDHAQDECCAIFRSDEEVIAPGLGTIVALVLESVLRGHSTCKEMPDLDIGEVYATYTTALQLEARNRPSKTLLLDINLLREELETIICNISQQLKLITDFRTDNTGQSPESDLYLDEDDNLRFEILYSSTFDNDTVLIDNPARAVLQSLQTDLQEKKDVFSELIKRADTLERQIVQRVDIIQEDHGKAILVFTIVSVIFLPLSFVSSYLGMNTADIRDMELNQALFWQVAVPVTVVVVALVLVGAYNAGRILGWVSRGAL
ncbi:uncharacterized protein BDV17DRAFT_226384 [Aspergillus undulatus]|uniref:uncharacterized protein n=1 Tax=Aspergillus undulatus TaxID=1810928 RepID=UPI003CCCF271